jgi:hypothetical protein
VALAILKKDNLKFGLVLGLLGPIVGLAVVYIVSYRAFTFGEFFNFFITDNKRITSIGALSLLANAVLFTLYINTHRDSTAKGIFLTTVIYGIGILVVKILN